MSDFSKLGSRFDEACCGACYRLTLRSLEGAIVHCLWCGTVMRPRGAEDHAAVVGIVNRPADEIPEGRAKVPHGT